SLPILSLMQLWGGIEPALLLASYAVTVATLCSLASLSMLCSVYCRKANSAIGCTFLIAILYLFFPLLTHLLHRVPILLTIPLTFGSDPYRVQDVVYALNAGNVFSAWMELGIALARGARLDRILPSIMRDYLLFHALATLLFSLWATAQLRPTARKQAE